MPTYRPDRMSRRAADRRVQRARALKSADEARALYRDWAGEYDRDIAEELKFTGGNEIAGMLAEHLDDRSAHIIDLGCGTGLVGVELRNLGFDRLDGLDLSPEMLDFARSKGLYGQLIEADLTQPLAIDDAAYGAAISAGTFTTGHVDANALGEVVRIVRPGGLVACVIACDCWQAGGFADRLTQMQDADQITMTHNSIRSIAQTGSAKAHFCILNLRP